jgi:hypothetical protein
MIFTSKALFNSSRKNVVFGGIWIKAIKLMLTVLILGMLVATGSAYEGAERQGHPHDGGHNNDFGGHQYDWLNPGGVTHYYSGWNSYSWYYPTYTYPNYYYSYPWYYPTYTYPNYYYSYPWYYPTYTYSW